jgi:D-alanyl-lipoteichoic acid acyltransferase DltB (MBOAT superfamily)
MNFVSVEFLLFFPVVLVLYWLLPFKYRWVLLLAASYIFYLYWNPWSLLLLFAMTVISYIAGKAIAPAKSEVQRRLWMFLTLVICLGCLVVFKYLGFLTENVTAILKLFGVPTHDIVVNIFLPIGISFYTFQALSYVIDVYRKEIEPERHFGYFTLYIAYFPQVVAGPIERSTNLLPQLLVSHERKTADMITGLQMILQGFFKKLVIADYLSTYVDVVYETPHQAGGPAIVLATIFFAFQIYCDFSGYSDIAVGTARMMGIQLMKNFDNPYSATSIQEFWRRWHISLTSWFTDYIYIPLGGSRRGIVRRCINVMIVFLFSGIWHGASWTFIIWGGIHGVYLVAGILWRNLRGEDTQKNTKGIRRAFHCICTFALVCFAWIFFRAKSLEDIGVLLGNLRSGWSVNGLSSTLTIMQFNALDVIRMVMMFACLPLLSRLSQRPVSGLDDGCVLQDDIHTALIVFEMIILISLAWVALLSVNAGSSFIYFQF